MIANVKFKITMRVCAFFDTLYQTSRVPAEWQLYLDEVPLQCGHRKDWRCMLANSIAAELPGTIVRVGRFNVEIDLPLLYPGSERTLRVAIPIPLKRALQMHSTPEGMQERRFVSCPISTLVTPSRRAHQRRDRRA